MAIPSLTILKLRTDTYKDNNVSRKSPDAQDRYDDLLLDTVKGVDKKIDKVSDELENNTKETRKINSRVYKLEAAVFSEPKPTTKEQLPAFWKDPAIIKLLLGIVLGSILLLAAYKGVDVTKLVS